MFHRRIKVLIVRNFILATAICVGVFAACFYLLLFFNLATLDELTKLVDVGFKASVVIASTIWALNRYYALRTDFPQLRVNAAVQPVGFPQSGSLMLLRIDLENTGKTLIESFQHYVEVQAVSPSGEETVVDSLYRWPTNGTHSGGPIEPGSWAAINDEFSCNEDVRVVRVFVDIRLQSGQSWTWHQSFDVSGGART